MGVEFNEDKHNTRGRIAKPEGLVGWLINKGIAKNEGQASIILTGFIIACIAITFLVNFLPNTGPEETVGDDPTNLNELGALDNI